jgi:CopG family nickel-responsive transcriptional regulator
MAVLPLPVSALESPVSAGSVITNMKKVIRTRGAEGVSRISVSLEGPLLERFDKLVMDDGYPTRSEAVKALISQALVQQEWGAGREVAGAVTMVYDHHKRSTVTGLLDVQHDAGDVIVASQHVHLDHHNCMEVVTVRGPGERIHALVKAMKSIKGIKHGALLMSTVAGEPG